MLAIYVDYFMHILREQWIQMFCKKYIIVVKYVSIGTE